MPTSKFYYSLRESKHNLQITVVFNRPMLLRFTLVTRTILTSVVKSIGNASTLACQSVLASARSRFLVENRTHEPMQERWLALGRKPGSHCMGSWHLNPPSSLMHVEPSAHVWLPSAHSSTSAGNNFKSEHTSQRCYKRIKKCWMKTEISIFLLTSLQKETMGAVSWCKLLTSASWHFGKKAITYLWIISYSLKQHIFECQREIKFQLKS